eukprot:CAMPEP_0194313240 /NCGR_PEP_ID=MMETSP0171-20130528/10130_1 /TAXON_ID=218684 /ORGANISM="Corethron pennatum, Strain L29A3" /LENGTH=539 /DNA_ID=CAMNT_0039068107 /DNA_START=480 /DNA_END=2099 /DNA_ORIENTATION=+
MIFQKIFIFAFFGVDTLLVDAQENLLLRKSASQSTDYNGDWTADNALDGAYGGFCTHTRQDSSDQAPWWEVDIGAETPMNTIKLFNRNHHPDRLSGVKVDLLDGDRKILHKIETNKTTTTGAVLEFSFETYSPQYLRLYGVASTPGLPPILTLCEVEAFLLIEPTTKPSTSPSTKTSLSPTSSPTTSPTTAFQAFYKQDFSIVEPTLLFFDNQGQFSVQMNYTVGLTASDLNITVMNENCKEIDDSMPDTIKIGHQFVKNHVFSKQVLIFKETFGTSPLVSEKNQATGASSGTLKFCVLVETLTEDGVPVSFRKTNVQLTYDLTTISFKVEGNELSENALNTFTKEVTSKYGISACRCTPESFDCDITKPLPLLEQNGYAFICIKPDVNSSSVKISNFDMRFEQDNVAKYTAVTLGNEGPLLDNLSGVQREGDSFKIVSRLVTVLFEKTSFDVKGNAYLVFKDARRSLATAPVQRLRSVQETTQEDSAGNVEFSMDVTLKKATGNNASKSANYAGIANLIVGAFAVVAILFLVIKKMNK